MPPAAADAGQASRHRRALIQVGVGAGIATFLFLVGHHVKLALFLYGISALFLISGFFIPPLYHVLDRIGRLLGKWAGIGLTWLLLIPFYYLCVFPGRLILLLMGKDPLLRRREHSQISYWTDRKPSDSNSYTRQY
jgi:hypothetical protein